MQWPVQGSFGVFLPLDSGFPERKESWNTGTSGWTPFPAAEETFLIDRGLGTTSESPNFLVFSLWKEGRRGRWVEKVKRWFCPLKGPANTAKLLPNPQIYQENRLWYKWEIQDVSANKACWTSTTLLLKKLFIINNNYLQYHCKTIRGLRHWRASGSSGWGLENSVTYQQTPAINGFFREGCWNSSNSDFWATLWSNPRQGEKNLPLTRSDKRKTSILLIRTPVWLGCVADHFSSFHRVTGTPEIISGLSSCVGAQEMNIGWFFTNLTYAEWVIICTLRHSINGSFKSQPTVKGLRALQKQESCSPAHRRIKKALLPRLQCDGNNRDQTNNSMFVGLPCRS